MALRDQPYLPLYIQDFLTDEKLSECSAKSTGVYIRLICIMHKSEEYGVILLKQKDKQTDKQIKNFAMKLVKQMPYSEEIIEQSLQELIDEKVLYIDENKLCQKRMMKDDEISNKRALAGKKGYNIKSKKSEIAKEFAQAKVEASGKANLQANSEYEIEYENEIEDVIIIEEDIDNIFEQYNLICTKLNQVSDLTKTRISLVKELLKQKGKDKILEVFRKANESDWLTGRNEKQWKANFDWIVDIDNFVKIAERTI